MTETIWAKKPHIFTILLFTKKKKKKGPGLRRPDIEIEKIRAKRGCEHSSRARAITLPEIKSETPSWNWQMGRKKSEWKTEAGRREEQSHDQNWRSRDEQGAG